MDLQGVELRGSRNGGHGGGGDEESSLSLLVCEGASSASILC